VKAFEFIRFSSEEGLGQGALSMMDGKLIKTLDYVTHQNVTQIIHSYLTHRLVLLEHTVMMDDRVRGYCGVTGGVRQAD